MTITDPGFNRMPLSGFEEGVWISFLNDADELIGSDGKSVAKPHHMMGFGMGVTGKTPKAKIVTKTATVPPGATKIRVEDMQWSSPGVLVSGAKPTYTIDKIVVCPL